jgi:UTP--glucose-1-phosphate uridylyltransferase
MQIRDLNERGALNVPLIIMNSFFTDASTRKAIENKNHHDTDFIQFFNQHKFPKILECSLEPVSFPSMPLLEWYPAGHGDLLLSLQTSGLLEQLIRTGYRYLFVSNIDNLGAEIDPCILGYFASENIDFLMEVTDRTDMDRKGGHLARLKSGPLVIREAAQCDRTDNGFFSDILRHRFFNTNNLWINTESALRMIGDGKYADLPMIVNRKRLVPIDPSSPSVCHLESALGSAISLFNKSAAVKVPRSRFIPVKNCDDLLLVWSDYYLLGKDGRIIPHPARESEHIALTLDSEFYSSVDLLESHFPFGAPSLINCTSFSVKGDVKFGHNIKLRGVVSITNVTPTQVTLPNDSTIADKLIIQAP